MSVLETDQVLYFKMFVHSTRNGTIQHPGHSTRHRIHAFQLRARDEDTHDTPPQTNKMTSFDAFIRT